MRLQDLIAMLADVIPCMAYNQRLCSRDPSNGRAVIWIAEDDNLESLSA
jgi:hypothetical protein